MKTRFKIKLMLMPFVVLTALTSCVKDYGHPIVKGDGETTVTFSLAVPGPSRASTRSLSVSDEGNVTQIDLLLFEDGIFRFSKPGSALNNTNPTKKTFEVTLPEGTYDIVIIANGRASILSANLQRGITPKEDALKALKHSLPVGTKWTSNTIPMWGYKDAVVIDQNTDLTDKSGSGGQDNSIKMSRMVSKIEVELLDAAAGAGNSNFAITSVRLYNYNDRGHLVPDMATDWDDVQGKAIAPTIPAGTVKTKGPLEYTAADDATGTFFTPSKVINTIYTFEADAGSTNGKLTNTCVVIGGSYQGSGSETHFYRVDFVKADKSYLSLLRNHKYTFRINSITGEGFTTPEEAFTAGPVNIEADVVKWNDGTVGDAVFDGQYYMVIRPSSELEFSRSPETQTVEIKTDYPAGWAVTKITEADGTTPNSGWLTTDKVIGALQSAGSFVAMDLTVTLNDTGVDRVGYIYVKAGRMELRIMVTQLAEDRLKLIITDVMGRDVNTITFDAATPIEQVLRVTFEPKVADLNIEVTQMGMDPFNYDNGDALVTNVYPGLNGSKSYNIKPRIYNLAINPFVENISKVEFMVTDGINIATKTIYLRQVNYAITTDQYDFYSLNNVEQTLNIKSNTTWEVKSVTGNEEILSGMTFADIAARSGGNNITGEPFKFKFIEDLLNVHKGKSITIVLTDPSGKALDKTVTLNALACGLRGQTANRTIGTNAYKTHYYIDKCWMVENTKEGTYDYLYYDYDATRQNGYYYNYANRYTACPPGWRLPEIADASQLISEIGGAFVPEIQAGKGLWWQTNTGNAFAGFRGPDPGRIWEGWELSGTWWLGADLGAGVYRQIASVSATSMTYLSTAINAVTLQSTIRCIEID